MEEVVSVDPGELTRCVLTLTRYFLPGMMLVSNICTSLFDLLLQFLPEILDAVI